MVCGHCNCKSPKVAFRFVCISFHLFTSSHSSNPILINIRLAKNGGKPVETKMTTLQFISNRRQLIRCLRRGLGSL
ncbi:hypothetical protein Hanom_Chr08g00682411 [Helianthus anomalus]